MAPVAIITAVRDDSIEGALANLFVGGPTLEVVERRIRVTALDQALRDIMERTGENFNVFMGTLDAMNDNLVAEALSHGVSVEKITHAMFSCHESRMWLHQLLVGKLGENDAMVRSMLDVLHLGIPIDPEEYAKAWVFSLLGDGVDPIDDGELDLTEYNETKMVFVEDRKVKVYRHVGGIYRVVGQRISFALVPHENGVKYYLGKTRIESPNRQKYDVQMEGKGPHLLLEKVAEMVKMGYNEVLVWRIVASTIPLARAINRQFFTMLELSFRIISAFRAELEVEVETARATPLEKRLLGSRSELIKLKQHVLAAPAAKKFGIDSTLYKNAKTTLLSKLDQAHGLSKCVPVTTGFLSLDNLETFMDLLGMLIKDAKMSDLNKGAKKQERSRFNARTVAILGTFNGMAEVRASLFPNQVQYFYQDDADTRSLCTPFGNLVIFATTGDLNDENLKQVQSIRNGSQCLNNWIALRAAFELDVHSGKFRRDTNEFRHAIELINEGMAKFVDDTTRRFSEFYEASPSRVLVSEITLLCQKMAERTGASSAWLIREMISRFIAKGASVENSGREQNDGYGRMELEMIDSEARKENCGPSKYSKVLQFDTKVSIQGLVCRFYTTSIEGDVIAILDHRHEDIPIVPLVRFENRQRPPDEETARNLLARVGGCTHIDLVDEEELFRNFHFLAFLTDAVVGEALVG